MDVLSCKKCSGNYILRDSKYGLFFGCSNFPKCKSTANFTDILYDYFSKSGIKIYRWEKECWKCAQKTDVYSYYMHYELGFIDEYLEATGCIGLGDIKILDRIIMDRIPTIKSIYSKTMNRRYIANTCSHCEALQGYNSVIVDPHEIFTELTYHHSMDKYLYEIIDIADIEDFKENLAKVLKYTYYIERE